MMEAGLVEGSLEFTKGEQLLRSSRLVHFPATGGAKLTFSVFGQDSRLVAHMLRSATAAPQYILCILPYYLGKVTPRWGN